VRSHDAEEREGIERTKCPIGGKREDAHMEWLVMVTAS